MKAPSVPLAYLVSQYPTTNHTYLLREIRGLRAAGWDVAVLSIRGPDRPVSGLSGEELSEFQSTFYVLGGGLVAAVGAHLRMLLSRPVGYLTSFFQSFRLAGFAPGEIPRWLLFFHEAVIALDRLRKIGVCHLHVHYASSVGLLASLVGGADVSQSIHGSAEFENPGPFRLREKVARAAFVRVISRYGKSQLMRFSDPRHWDKIEVCALGVDPAQFPPSGRRPQPGEPFELLTVGQLAPAKGQHILISALARLTAQGRKVRLRIVGDGALRASLEDQARRLGVRDRVVFEGFRDNRELPDYYRRADAFVLPSFAEGVPVVLMEAMAMEVPCVASRITGIPELIEDGVSGLLVPPADEHALAGAIARLMDEENLSGRLGRAARERVLADYQLETNLVQLVDLFRRRLGDARASKQST
jgi:glycosyltransferase involved in cell wall biosynthesis